MNPPPVRKRRSAAFTFIELLVITALSATVLTASALAYRAISSNQKRVGGFQTVKLSTSDTDSTVFDNYFRIQPGTPVTGQEVDSYVAPNYGRVVMADSMRNLYNEDVEGANGVICLPRTGLNAWRPSEIALPAGTMPGMLDTPAAFHTWLADNAATASAAAAFLSYRGTPPETHTPGGTSTALPVVNGTIFIFTPSGSNTALWLRAIYEIDYRGFTDSTGVPCVYANVRRYVTGVLTHYYDCVFRNNDISEIGQPFVHFEKSARSTTTDGVAAFKRAGAQPFYLVWWPDPGRTFMKANGLTYSTSSPQYLYRKHSGQTDFSFVTPQFPML